MDWMGRNDEGTRNMGKFWCEACFQNREQVGRDEREEGTCWRNQDGQIEEIGFLHVGRVCLRSGGQIKPGGGGRGCSS